MLHDPVVPRVSRAGLLGLVATTALLMLAAVAALLSRPTHSSAAPPPPAAVAPDRPSLPPRQVGDRVLQYVAAAGPIGVERDRSDPALLHVVVASGTQPIDCNVIRPDVRVVAQNATTVRLAVSGWEYVPRAAARTGQGGTTCVNRGSTALPVHLAAALGSRRVFTGRSLVSTTVTGRG